MINLKTKTRNKQAGAALTEVLAVVIAVAIAVGILVTKLKPGEGIAQYIPGIVSPGALVLGKADKRKAGMVRMEADATILYTKKVACRANVNIINTSVEMWHIEKGTWPKEDMSDIGRDRFYFPNGIPKCPVNNTPYRIDPFLKRIVGHEHVDIPDPFHTEQAAQKKKLGEKKPAKKKKEKTKKEKSPE